MGPGNDICRHDQHGCREWALAGGVWVPERLIARDMDFLNRALADPGLRPAALALIRVAAADEPYLPEAGLVPACLADPTAEAYFRHCPGRWFCPKTGRMLRPGRDILSRVRVARTGGGYAALLWLHDGREVEVVPGGHDRVAVPPPHEGHYPAPRPAPWALPPG